MTFATKAPMPHYPCHLSTFDYRGFHRYFLTFCTFERNHYFERAESVAIALTAGGHATLEDVFLQLTDASA